MIIVTNSDILGKNIRYLRQKQGMTCKALSDLVGWDDLLLEELEADISREIDSKILAQISKVFHRDMNDMLTKDCK